MVSATDIPRWTALAFLIGAASALAGGYLDDAWHTIEGRDSAFIAPHIAIYTGIALAGGSLAGWALLVAMRSGPHSVLRNGPLLIALLAVGLTLASAPIDNAWHIAFGRDSVIWSPPHILGIVGTLGLAVAMLVALHASPAPWARRLVDPTGGLLIAAASFVVVEYDTDVPQFSYLWYLPALSLAAGFALAVIRRLSAAQLASTRAALWHLGFVFVVSALLLALSYDAVRLPALVLPALALDLSVRRGLTALARAGVVTAAIAIPSLVLLTGTSGLAASQLLLSAALAFVAVLATTALVLGPAPGIKAARVAAAVSIATIVLSFGAEPPSAQAHDPGQGTSVGTVDLAVRAHARVLTMTAKHIPSTDGATAWRVVARREGRVRSAPLTRSDGSASGSVEVDADGRWFVYLEAQLSGGRQLESWLPVDVGQGTRVVHEARRFAYTTDESNSTAVKAIVGVVLYAIVAAFLAALAVLVRRSSPPRAGDPASA